MRSARIRPRIHLAAFGSLLLSTVPVKMSAAESALRIDEIFCNSGPDGLGIDSPRPGLSWSLASTARGHRQSAYQIQVASSPERLARGDADAWDSGKITSDQSLQVSYGGHTLRSRDRCFWRVRAWDGADGPTEFSPIGTWEMGLLDPADWQAKWIGYPAGWPGRALYFRHEFAITRPFTHARAYVAGLGYHELRLNGQKVGDHVLDPGWTDYARRVLYVTHDIGAQLRVGRNAVGVIVGNGWYGTPVLLLQIEITFADGSRQTIATHGGHTRVPDVWFVSSGPVTTNSIYDGETYDARLEKPDWDLPGERRVPEPLDRSEGWETATEVTIPRGARVAQMLEPIKVVETRRAEKITEPRPGVYVFDTGQNLAGWAALRVRGPRGTGVTLRFAESLRADGTINGENLRKARATDTYILKGDDEETWEPRFTYHGFRYVQVEGWPDTPTLDSVQIRVVRSAVAESGTFRCSNELLNRIHRMVTWTEAGNLHSVPTDCPQRDERMGWLNDMTVRIETALYRFRLARFYAKFLDDVADTQGADGTITDTAPFKWGKRPADPVSASYLLLAWQTYLHYGDTEPMRTHYAGFRRWVDYLATRSTNGILSYSSWGDWAPPATMSVAGSIGAGAISAQTPGELISTGFLHYQARLLAQMAGVLGNESERVEFEQLAARVAQAFNEKFWNEATGGYGSNNQACNAFALFLQIVPPERVTRVVENLIRAVDDNDGHLTTGNLCTKYLLETLTEHGHVDVAYRIATQTTYPSWGFMLENGATTLWERWEHLTGGAMNSHNHPMLGSVGSWFFKHLAGIRVEPAGAGFSRIVIEPFLPEDLEWAEGSYRSLRGLIQSAWRKDGTRVHFSISVPANTVATVRLPAASNDSVTERGKPLGAVEGVTLLSTTARAQIIELGSGDYEFLIQRR